LNYTPQAEDFPGESAEPGWYVTPEAQTVRDVYKEIQDQFGVVDVFIDLHHHVEYVLDVIYDPVTLLLSAVFLPKSNTDVGEQLLRSLQGCIFKAIKYCRQ